MEFIVYKEVYVWKHEELERVNITSIEELENLYKKYGQEGEPLHVNFDSRRIVIEPPLNQTEI